MIRRIKEEAKPTNPVAFGIVLAAFVLGLVGLNRLARKRK